MRGIGNMPGRWVPMTKTRGRRGPPRLQLLPLSHYRGIVSGDPIRFYHWPVLGALYRRRVELCLGELRGGEKVLEVGFGSGLAFLNLAQLYGTLCGIDLNPFASEVRDAFLSIGIHAHLLRGSVLEIPCEDDCFDAVLLISILEHLKPDEMNGAFTEIRRVLKPGGQAVYGVPVERPFMVMMFRLLGYNIREHHFSTHSDVAGAAGRYLDHVRVIPMYGIHRSLGAVYEVGHFKKGRQGNRHS